MSELTFEDYKDRISITEVLEDAGYRFYRRDGKLWPSYCRTDNDGRRVRGDKFVVCSNGKACFQPPEQRRYNVISFIAEHPHLFREGNAGKDPYTVVNEVCHRLLNTPMEERKPQLHSSQQNAQSFSLSDYQCEYWKSSDWEQQRKFFPYFAPRAITRQTQQAFAGSFILTRQRDKTASCHNLSFPMRIPGVNKIVGLEQRGLPDAQGKSCFKGMARGTNATEGVWFASPAYRRSLATELDKIKDVYWFESAWDAMAYYQLRTDPLRRQIAKLSADPSARGSDTQTYLDSQLDKYRRALYVSTGGSPSLQQLKGVLKKTCQADQHICFDNDRAGHLFAIDLVMARAGKTFQTAVLDDGQLQVIDKSGEKEKVITLDLDPFDFDRIAHILGAGNPDMKNYIASLSDPNDIKSGDYDFLPSRTLVSSYYDKIYALEEQARNGELYQGISPEHREEVTSNCRIVMNELRSRFDDILQRDITAYRHHRSSIGIEEPPQGYKDWNDVIMEKRQYEESDTLSAMGEDGEMVTGELSQNHEEEVHRNEDAQETARSHFRR